ncbi:MAG: ComF family protein, partial [bacterium]|nr:ComF family protein [bacterium]
GLNFLKTPAHLPRLKKQYFENAYSALAYEGDVLDWVHQYKYYRQFHFVPSMGALLFQLELEWERYDAITYVPLHWRRQWMRGFNPAHLLADQITKKTGLALVHALKKTKHTKPQAKMDGEERLQNIKDVFGLSKNALRQINGKNLLLIDDVLTTGSTANECAKVLKNAKAKTVAVLTLARAL